MEGSEIRLLRRIDGKPIIDKMILKNWIKLHRTESRRKSAEVVWTCRKNIRREDDQNEEGEYTGNIVVRMQGRPKRSKKC